MLIDFQLLYCYLILQKHTSIVATLKTPNIIVKGLKKKTHTRKPKIPKTTFNTH
mgnify:CR=1 FL=1